MELVYILTWRAKINNTYILGKYTVSSSLVLFFSFFYRFASSVIFQTYSHLNKTAQLILGKTTCWCKSCMFKNFQLCYVTWLSSLSKLELSLLRIYRFWKSSPLSSLICSLNFWSGLKKKSKGTKMIIYNIYKKVKYNTLWKVISYYSLVPLKDIYVISFTTFITKY